MSSIKRHMDDQQALYDQGLELCIEVGAIEECEYHPGCYYDGGGDVEDAYKLANSKITKGEIELAAGQSRQTVTDAIKGAYDDNYGLDGCPSCAKWDRE